MNSLMNKKKLPNNMRIARSTLLSLIVCCFMVISHTAFAQYQPDIEATDTGGGTWGEILRMNVRIEGSGATFSITSKKGPFYNTNSVTIRSGSHDGPIIVAEKIAPGSKAANLQVDLDAVVSFPQSFFATITNNIGYAWVGPIQISKDATAIGEPVPWEDSQANAAPQRPLIDESPENAEIDSVVNITVTAGQNHSNDMVRVQCTASSSDTSPSSPYRSDWVYSGDTIKVPLIFHSAGTQVVFCNTLNSQGMTSSLSQRTITVIPVERFAVTPPALRNNFSEPSESYGPPATPRFTDSRPPRMYTPPAAPASALTAQPDYAPPTPNFSTPAPNFAETPPPGVSSRRRITSTPAPSVEVPDQGSVNTPISIRLIAGLDPQNRDLVRIGCTAGDSDRTPDNPYLSDWLPPEGEAKGAFTFYSPGEKTIYCNSYSRQGVTSPSTGRTLNIRFANQAPEPPVISDYPYTTEPGRTTYITVTAGADPDGDRVRVKCSATDSSVTGNTPYLSEWVAPQATVSASLAFFTAGNKEISCISIDSKDAQSSPATRKIHVHTSQYTSEAPSPDYNFNNRSGASNSADAQNCPCQHRDKAQGEEIDFNRPYIPGSPAYSVPDRQSLYQPPKRQADLSGRVVYRSSGMPAQNAMIRIWNPVSGQAYTATTDFDGSFEFNFLQKDLSGQIQATIGDDTSIVREVQVKPDQPAVIDLTIMDSAPAPQQSYRPSGGQAAPPAYNNIWQFN